ncbi:MAG TPA: divalent-cation tolerance protein CutA [Candidatus Eisenbacteria bacterium]|nr:divalent-cation tolerance protein CutA [Candidatus Eisenbacteria bacterium]
MLVLTTAPNGEVAAELAATLVEERLAACVSRLPGLISRYRWQGAVEEETEVLVLLKTRASLESALLQRLVEIHPYEVPEALVLPVSGGHPPYLDWLTEATRG